MQMSIFITIFARKHTIVGFEIFTLKWRINLLKSLSLTIIT